MRYEDAFVPLQLVPQPRDVGLQEGEDEGSDREGGHHLRRVMYSYCDINKGSGAHLQLSEELRHGGGSDDEAGHVAPDAGPRPRRDPLAEADQRQQELLDLLRVRALLLRLGEEVLLIKSKSRISL